MGHGQKIEMAGRRVCGMPSSQRPLVRLATWVALRVGAEPAWPLQRVPAVGTALVAPPPPGLSLVGASGWTSARFILSGRVVF